MNVEEFRGSPAGDLVRTVEEAWAFVPKSLPDDVALDPRTVFLLDRAGRNVANLSGIGETLLNPHLLIQPFIRREAVLSSRIEGTQASLSDLYEFEAGARPGGVTDALEVANYVRALERGVSLLDELPICIRLVSELHRVLLTDVRGDDTRPGEFRDRQVWIGAHGTPIHTARFVPPPNQLVPELMSNWERFVNATDLMPPLVRCALLHYQFETIHPFRDGNGRIGRLLITLFLIATDVLTTPLLYLSAYFERNRSAYYDHLLTVSRTGDFLPWLQFFLEGVAEQSSDAIERARTLRLLHEDLRMRLVAASESANAFQLVDALFVNPFVTRPRAAKELGITTQGARNLLRRLEQLGVLRALPGTRPERFVAVEIVDALNA